MKFLRNKKIVVIGGGTAGWLSALYFLSMSKKFCLDLTVDLIADEETGIIGVGEGTTPPFRNFIKNVCNISDDEFLKNTNGSFKYGIKFDNWNFNNEYYYHLFSNVTKYDNNSLKDLISMCQYCVNNELDIPFKLFQKKYNGLTFDLVDNNKINLFSNNAVSYHFAANLVIKYFKEKCQEFENFKYFNNKVVSCKYYENNFIKNLILENDIEYFGDIFINCMGFHSKKIFTEEMYDIVDISNLMPNDKAVTLQYHNNPDDEIEPYTWSTAQDYGWTWKIPQWQKTGCGYVFSSSFLDEEKSYDTIIKTHNIDEKNIISTKVINFESYYNKKQLNGNCLHVGLSSGFIEPLEATNLHMAITTLDMFFSLLYNIESLSSNYSEIFNKKMNMQWVNNINFILYHYFNGSTKNDYWKHYTNLKNSEKYSFLPEKYMDITESILTTNFYSFDMYSFFSVGLGMKIKDYYYPFEYEKINGFEINQFFSNKLLYNFKEDLSHKEYLSLLHK